MRKLRAGVYFKLMKVIYLEIESDYYSLGDEVLRKEWAERKKLDPSDPLAIEFKRASEVYRECGTGTRFSTYHRNFVKCLPRSKKRRKAK